MFFILCSLTFVIISLVAQVNSQLPPKRIGEWSPDRSQMYPNPWVNSSQCQTTETSGLCDYNKILTPEQRKYFIEQPEMKKVSTTDHDTCLCNKDCGAQIRIIVTVAIMKKIGPHISDYREAAEEFAKKFRPAWNLDNCSLILIASKGDNVSFVEAGSEVISLISANVTEKIDRDIYEKYFMEGRFVEGINATLIEYRKALAAAAAAATPTGAMTPASELKSSFPVHP